MQTLGKTAMTKLQFFAAGASLAALLSAGAAAAQEQDYSWTGFYAGVNLGGAWGKASNHVTASSGTGAVTIPPGDITTINGIGTNNSNALRFTGGGEAGYNYQSGHLLLGLETDFDAFQVKQIKSTTFNSALLINPPVTYTIGQKVTTDWLWTIRPRIGYAAGRWLVYGTAGMAMTPITLLTTYSDTLLPPNAASIAVNKTKTGWTAGLGGAYAFTPHLSIKAEWLYSDFGTVQGSATTASGYASFVTQASVKANLVRMGVDYRF